MPFSTPISRRGIPGVCGKKGSPDQMASVMPITASLWKVQSASLGCRSRPGTLVSGPLVSRCKPMQSVHHHWPKQGHNHSFTHHSSGTLRHSFSLRPERSNLWSGKIQSFPANLSSRFVAVVAKAADGSLSRRLVLWNHENQKATTREVLEEALVICKKAGCEPQVCYVSMEDVRMFDRKKPRVVKFMSHCFKIPKILEEFSQMPKGNDPPIKTVLIVGTDRSNKEFTNTVNHLTGEDHKFGRRKTYVARLKIREIDGNWHESKTLEPDEWELETLEI